MSLESGPVSDHGDAGRRGTVGVSVADAGGRHPAAARSECCIGNLDREMREFLSRAIPVLIPFFAFALGANLDLGKVWHAGLLGVGLGVAVVVVTGIPLFFADRLTGGSGVAGVAAASTAGNAVAVPAIIASANPAYAGRGRAGDHPGRGQHRGHRHRGAAGHRMDRAPGRYADHQ